LIQLSSPDPNKISSPSNITLSSLATSVASQTALMEHQLNEKAMKKNKFDDLSIDAKQMILNASSASGVYPET